MSFRGDGTRKVWPNDDEMYVVMVGGLRKSTKTSFQDGAITSKKRRKNPSSVVYLSNGLRPA